MHHFFINKNNIIDAQIIFEQRDFQHMTKVLRLRKGEIVSASDGTYFYSVSLTELENEVRGKILNQQPAISESPLHTILVQGIAKGEKMDVIVQKATELGVSEIIPVETTYCIVKLDNKKKQDRTERWQKIALEASKQSKRTLVPRVHTPLTLREAFAILPQDSLKLILWESENKQSLKEILENTKTNSIVLIIGPEGGLSEEEVALAKKFGIISVSLGKRILRTETAGMSALAIVQFALGDLGGKSSAN